jgi:hypothetical protein
MKHSHISESKFKAIIKLFGIYLESIQIAAITKTNKNSINRILQLVARTNCKIGGERMRF